MRIRKHTAKNTPKKTRADPESQSPEQEALALVAKQEEAMKQMAKALLEARKKATPNFPGGE